MLKLLIPVPGNVVNPRPRTEEEKKAELQRLREKAAAKLKEKEQQEEIDREARRRRDGRELVAAKEKLEETQMKQLAEQRRKEKVLFLFSFSPFLSLFLILFPPFSLSHATERRRGTQTEDQGADCQGS